jgi:hypothetical protein
MLQYRPDAEKMQSIAQNAGKSGGVVNQTSSPLNLRALRRKINRQP